MKMKLEAGKVVGKSDSEDPVEKLDKTKSDVIIEMNSSKMCSQPLLSKPSLNRASSQLVQESGAIKLDKDEDTRFEKFKSNPQYNECGTLFFYMAVVLTFGLIYFHATALIVEIFKTRTYAPHTWCPISWLIRISIDWLIT